MNPEASDLIKRAAFCGNMFMPYRWHGENDPVFREITHYFNAEMFELGYIIWPGDPDFESVHIFNPPRAWHAEMLERLKIKALLEVPHSWPHNAPES